MAENFEEQFLLVLSPYDRNVDAYPMGHPQQGQMKKPEPVKNADAWTQAVREDIKKISQTKVGSLLLRSIRHHGKVVTIRPRQEGSNCGGARTSPGDVVGTAGVWDVITGATIAFNPDTYKIGGTCSKYYLGIGGFHIESDEVLLHELVHAFRKVSGKEKTTPLSKGLIFYDDNEDFNAVLVQGIYASERRKPIRASHFRHFEIAKELNGSLKFFKSSSEAFKYVEKFCLENPGFTKGFININTHFNPINAYYQDREIARQFSRSAFARGLDVIAPIVANLVHGTL
jgi:Effector protein